MMTRISADLRALLAHYVEAFEPCAMGGECRDSRLISVAACGESPAFAQYRERGAATVGPVLAADAVVRS